MNTKTYYPVSLDLSGRRCLVVGGGSVAKRKVVGLLNAGAEVIIVSPILNSDLELLVNDTSVQWIKSDYHKDCLTGACIVIGSTDSSDVNKQISFDAKSAGIPVNIADDPDLCTFILPAICKKGDIQIAVCTSGAAPGISALIRDTIDSCIGGEYEILVAALKELRSRIKNLRQNSKTQFWHRIKELDINSYHNNPDSLINLVNTWVDEAEKNVLPE